MTDYLLDTSAMAILDPRRGLLTPELQAWFTIREPRLHLSTVVVFEAIQGTERLVLQGQKRRAAAIEAWVDGIVHDLGDRILPLDRDTSRAAGRLSALAFRRGNHPGAADIFIAATAQVHGLLLLTRNVQHFADLGIDIADPLLGLPR